MSERRMRTRGNVTAKKKQEDSTGKSAGAAKASVRTKKSKSGVDGAPVAALRRKAQAAREAAEERQITPARALRLAFARTADEVLGLALSAMECLEKRDIVKNIYEASSNENCMLLLEGPEGARGLLELDISTIVALIEIQTTGIVRQGKVEPRKLTATDAALAQPLIDGALSRVEVILPDKPSFQWIRGYRYGTRIPEARAIPLVLEDVIYRVFEMELDLGSGARKGAARLILPQELPQIAKPEAPTEEEEKRAALNRTVMELPASLDVVIARQRHSWASLAGFEVGKQIPLPGVSLAEARLETEGRLLSKVRIGQLDGFRAIRQSEGNISQETPDFSSLTPTVNEFAGSVGDFSEELGVSSDGGGQEDFPDLPSLGELPSLELEGSEEDAPSELAEFSDSPEEVSDFEAATPDPDLSSLPDLPDLPKIG